MRALELRSINLGYHGQYSVNVLDGLDLDVDQGEIHAIVGPSGSGKSTLLAVAGLLQRPDEGRVHVGGVRVDELGEAQRTRVRSANIGFVFQTPMLLPHLTLSQNVTIPLLAQRWRTGDEDALALLDSVGLADLRDRLPSEISIGQAQRVSLCRALIRNPPVLIADEPTASLDEASARTVRELLVDVSHSRGVAILLATHDAKTAECASSVSTLSGGTLAASEVIRARGLK